MKILIMITLYYIHHIDGNIIQKPFNNQTEIVGGQPVEFKDFTFLAYLKISKTGETSKCTGTILSDIFILTAAHCVLGKINLIIITIGNIYYESGDNYFTNKYYSNALYRGPQPDNDIGIVKAESKMKLDGVNAKPVKLADENYSVHKLSQVTVAGWGATKENGDESTILNSARLPVISQADCQKTYKGKVTITTRTFCAGDLKKGGVSSCVGDSGGPAIDVAGVQVGIVSGAIGCARAAYPTVFTNVAAMRSYIYFVTRL